MLYLLPPYIAEMDVKDSEISITKNENVEVETALIKSESIQNGIGLPVPVEFSVKTENGEELQSSMQADADEVKIQTEEVKAEMPESEAKAAEEPISTNRDKKR